MRGRSIATSFQADPDLRCDSAGIYPGKSNAERGRVVFGNNPRRLTPVFFGDEHAASFRETGLRVDQAILPSRYPVCLTYRTQQREHGFGWSTVGLSVFVSNTHSLRFGHFLLQKKMARARGTGLISSQKQ